MALKLAKELLTGVTGDYWHIHSLGAWRNEGGWSISAQMALFLDEASRLAGKDAIHFITCHWPLNTPLVDIFADAYRIMKTLPEFEGATDC